MTLTSVAMLADLKDALYSDVVKEVDSFLYESVGLLLTVCACHWGVNALNFGLDASFDSKSEWKGMRKETRGNIGMKSSMAIGIFR
jgi:hypothetical protein